MDVHSTVSQLTNAYKKHYRYSKEDKEEISHLLLLFYAVECGLKSFYLKERKLNNTSDLENDLKKGKHGYGHDIWEWHKLLKLPKQGYADEVNRPIVQMHQRLRYGCFSKTLKENEQIKFLKDIAFYLKDKI